MASKSSIEKHFKTLRVQTARRRRDPFAEDDSSEEERDRRRSKSTVEKPVIAPPAPPPAPSIAPGKSSALAAADKLLDSEDDWLAPAKRNDRRPSPAPSQLPRSPVSAGAGRRGSLDVGLQSQGLQPHRDSRSARAQAAGPLAYLDDSDDEEALQPPPRVDRNPSPAPSRKSSDSAETQRRSSTPRGSRDAPNEQNPVLPSRHTVASPFAGTKYLEDSDSNSDDEAVTSRSNSTDETAADRTPSPGKKEHLEVKRVDKPKVQNGGGVSWRAFSASRTEQRNTELEALQSSLRKRGKSITFGAWAVTDDGQQIPIAQQFLSARTGSKKGRNNRGKSPPRRAEDTAAAEDEVADGGPVGVYDPKLFRTNPFTGSFGDLCTHKVVANYIPGEPVRRKESESERDADTPRSPNGGSIPSIRVEFPAI